MINEVEVWAEIDRLVAANKQIEAIKAHRTAFRTTLREAKEALGRRRPMRTITKKEDMPQGKHFAILEFSGYQVPGDERSRTNPGHGYPAHTVRRTSYRATEDAAEWKNEIAKLAAAKETFVAFRAGPVAKITLRTDVVIEDEFSS